MKKIIIILIGMIALIGIVFAYTAPIYNDIDLVLENGYTAPTYNNIDLVLGVVSDTCTYSSGNWEVNCNDNCSITTNVDLTGNTLIISGGDGSFEVLANITMDELMTPKGVNCELINIPNDGNELRIKHN